MIIWDKGGRKYSSKLWRKQVLKDINIKVDDGEIVSIIGPNGSGKSTLIKALSRCIKLSHGSVYLGDLDIATLPNKLVARKMAILPQIKKYSHGYYCQKSSFLW